MSMASAIDENLFKAHERFLWGLCYRMTGNAADADDLVQETLASLHAKRASYDPSRPFLPWRIVIGLKVMKFSLVIRRLIRITGGSCPSVAPIHMASLI